jgi:hypothetical protein
MYLDVRDAAAVLAFESRTYKVLAPAPAVPSRQ